MVTITRNQSPESAENWIRIANAEVELLLATEFGPRVMRYAKCGGRNVLGEVSPREQGNPTPFGDAWHIYGGHRLWYAPEDAVRTYWPDNQPVSVEHGTGAITLVQAVEGHTGLRKSITVELDEHTSEVRLLHRIENRGNMSWELAPWALTVMAKGGFAIFAQPEFVPHPRALAPARPLVVWPFTRMNDARWTWGDRYLFLRHDPARADAQKVGLYDTHGYLAYALDDVLFVKCHSPQPGAHADFGCNVETFTNDAILELETLGPLVRLSPGASVEHRERWYLFDGMRVTADEGSVAAALGRVLPHVTR